MTNSLPPCPCGLSCAIASHLCTNQRGGCIAAEDADGNNCEMGLADLHREDQLTVSSAIFTNLSTFSIIHVDWHH